MALLLNTDIEQRVNTCMTGLLARDGGKVEQLFAYKNCRVEDINGYPTKRLRYDKSTIF